MAVRREPSAGPLPTSGQLGPPRHVTGLQLLDHRGEVRALLDSSLPKSLAKRAQPATDLFQTVDAGHMDLWGRQRGQTLPPALGPSPRRSPPVEQSDPAASCSHAGL